MSQKILNILTVVFAICSFVFFIIGCIGYASAERAMRNVAWITASQDFGSGFDFEFWCNLTGYYAQGGGFHQLIKFTDCVNSSDDEQSDFCSQCLSDGNASFGLLIAATTFAFFVIVLSGLVIGTPNSAVQLGALITSFVSGCFSLIGFGIFMGSCYWKIDNISEFNLHYGPGAILVLLGLLMMWVNVFFQVGAVALGGK